MATSSPVILILGSGSNIGQGVARAFAAKGYKVALASRSQKEEDSTAQQLNIAADLSNPDSVANVFSKVKASLGLPSVVVYNGKNTLSLSIKFSVDLTNSVKAAKANPGNAKNPLALSLSAFTGSLNINTISAFVAAQQAVLGFEQLPKSAPRTFIYTGNLLNIKVMPTLLDLGVGKSATAHIIENASTAYADQGFKYAFPICNSLGWTDDS